MTSVRNTRRRAGAGSSGAAVTAATVAVPLNATRPQSVEERASHEHPNGLAEPGHVVDGSGERQAHVVIPVLVLDAQLDAVAVESQRTHAAAAQRRGQPAGEPVDHFAVRGLEVLQPAGLERTERI